MMKREFLLANLKNGFRIIPALLLLTAAFTKISNPLAFANELDDYNLPLGIDLKTIATLFLPFLESFLGIFLLCTARRWVSVAAIFLLTVFSAGILWGLPDGYLQKCGCLGPENLSPAIALLKNGVVIALLITALVQKKGENKFGNNWGALSLILGGVMPSITPLLLLFAAVGLSALWQGKKQVVYSGIGLLFGLGYHLLSLPLLLLPVVAFLFYILPLTGKRESRLAPFMISTIVLGVTFFHLIYPPPSSSVNILLYPGQIWSEQVCLIDSIQKDNQGRSIIIFLDPDCEECRLWLPMMKSIARRKNLPPVTGITTQTEEKIRAYQKRENISFPILPTDLENYENFVKRTPLMIVLKSDTISHVFSQGTLPPPDILEKELAKDDE